jgi:hypothetical protein
MLRARARVVCKWRVEQDETDDDDEKPLSMRGNVAFSRFIA